MTIGKHCGSLRSVKHGIARGKQRYRCEFTHGAPSSPTSLVFLMVLQPNAGPQPHRGAVQRDAYHR